MKRKMSPLRQADPNMSMLMAKLLTMFSTFTLLCMVCLSYTQYLQNHHMLLSR